MKDWYQVQESGLEIIHDGKTAKPGEFVYLTKEQAKLHDKGVALADKPPGKIAEVTAANDFNEWKQQQQESATKEAVKPEAAKPETVKKSSAKPK